MADEELEPQGDEASEEQPEKKGGLNKKLIILIAVVVLLGAGGGGVFVFKDKIFGGKPAQVEDQEAEEAASLAQPQQSGPTLDLEAFTVNLAAGSAKRVCKLGLQLELRDAESKKNAENRMAPIRDTVIMYMPTRTDAEILQDPEMVKNELRRRLNNVLGEGAVRNIYITELLMQ